MATTLVLVDADNLWVDRAKKIADLKGFPLAPRGSEFDRRRPFMFKLFSPEVSAVSVPPEGYDRVWVVFAANTKTVCDSNLSFDDVSTFSTRLTNFLALPGKVETELALGLKMPQAADVLLQRLCVEAPDESRCGPITEVWLLSKDKGLRCSIANLLNTNVQDTKTDWYRWRLQQPFNRRAPEKTRSPQLGGLPPLCDWSTRVTRASQVTQELVARPIDLLTRAEPNSISLVEVCKRVEGVPGLLSQIGVTLYSVRGVERLRQLVATGAAPIGALSEREGVELHFAKALAGPCAFKNAEFASVGPGAVFSSSLRATVRSELPASVVASRGCDASASFGPTSGRLDDAQVLRRMSALTPAGNSVWVKISRRGDRLQAAVDHEVGIAPDVWWKKTQGTKRVVSVRNLQCHSSLLSNPIYSVSAIATSLDQRELVLMSAMDDTKPGDVILDRDVRRGQLGLGRWGGKYVLVLAVGAPLKAGLHTLVRIQRCSAEDLERLHPSQKISIMRDGEPQDCKFPDWGELRRLPLLVQTPATGC